MEGGLDNTWFDPKAFGGRGGVLPSFTEADVRDVSLLPGVKGVMSLGSVLSVELKSSVSPASSYAPREETDASLNTSDSSASLGTDGGRYMGTAAFTDANDLPVGRNSRYYNNNASAVVVSLLKQNNVYARPLGNVVYLMPTPLTPEADRKRLIRVIKRYCIIP